MDDKMTGGFGLKSGQGLETIGGVSGKELRWSQWWVDHREQVRKGALGVFIAADVLLVGFGAWGFIDWLAIGGVKEQLMIRQMTSPEYARFQSLTLNEVQIGAPIVLSGGSGKIDILTPVENTNPMFWAELEYRYLVGGTELPLRRAFVLPGRAKYLAELGAPSDGGVELRIERRRWHRAELQGSSNAEALAETRLNVYAANAVYAPSDPLATSPVSSAQFTLMNDTAFGYYDVDLLVLLYRGDAVVGVNTVRVDTLPAGARKPMELFWFQLLPQVTKVEVVPDINIYDSSVYRAPR